MPFLILLSKIFTSLFGITNPKPEEEKKYALTVFALLCLLAIAMLGLTSFLL